MEACYAEGSKSRGDAVPQISLRPLAHQSCIRRDSIVAVAPTTGDPGQSFGLVSSFKLSQQTLRFLLRQSSSHHLFWYSPLAIKFVAFGELAFIQAHQSLKRSLTSSPPEVQPCGVRRQAAISLPLHAQQAETHLPKTST